MADTESLVAKNPFELRIDQAARISEGDVRAALASGDMGFLHSYTTGSAVDGPGVRVVAWTSGCMWRCRYCHNPDTWKVGNGLPVSVARAVEVLKKYAHGLSVMAGGLMQHRFATKLLAAAKNMRIHTVIETNGYVGDRLTDADLANIDLVMLGIKSWGEDRHKDLTGVDLAPTLDFARRLAALGKPMWIRFVFVPGLTDDPAIAGGIAEFAADLGNVQRVDVLPFHQMGRYKWQALGLQYSLDDVAPPTQEALEGAVGIFRSQGLTAH
jgi:pyruvate formate lyase activating enzyme